MDVISSLPKYTCITILPHDTIDVDAAISAILLSKLFDFYNIPNEIAIFDEKIDRWTTYFMKKLNLDLSKFEVKKEDKNKTLFLVDHYQTCHEGTVIGCIDHHLTLEKMSYNYYLYKPACSTAYMIYKIMESLNFPITKEIILYVGYASLVDTCSFKSSKTVLEEKDEIISLLKTYNFNVEEMLKECLCLDNLEKMPLEEIVLNGLKTYNFGKSVVKSSYVQTSSLEISQDIIHYISKIVDTEKLDMWVFIVSDLQNEKQVVYKITKNQVFIEKYDSIMSRGKYIMPIVEKQFTRVKL